MATIGAGVFRAYNFGCAHFLFLTDLKCFWNICAISPIPVLSYASAEKGFDGIFKIPIWKKERGFMMKKRMKFCIAVLFAICLLSVGGRALAAPICPVPREVTQPDGTQITVTTYGDEFFSWSEDENGNVVAYDEATDSYRYAKIEDGQLVPSSEKAGDTSLRRATAKKLQREDILPLWENADRIDYSQSREDTIQLASAEAESTGIKKLLTLLIEFNDVKLKYDGDFWAKQMYSSNPKDISVVNYWKENANGRDVFEASDTSGIVDGVTGKVSSGDYKDIRYAVIKCPDGVVKVSLDMPHPIKTWTDATSTTAINVLFLTIEAIKPYFDFTEQIPYMIAVFAGYDVPYGDGKGQMKSHALVAGGTTPSGIKFNKCVFQGELWGDKGIPTGIGVTCHELGHAAFGLPDLYFSILPNAGWTNNGLMYCSLMSTGCWGRLYNLLEPSHNVWDDPYAYEMNHVPSHLDPWCKMQCGFLIPTIINEWDGNINSISEMGVDSHYNVLEIRSKTDANQYFLVENRQLIGYDSGLEQWSNSRKMQNPFEGGIIIYHVDEGVFSSYNNDACYHHFIQVEQSIPDKDDSVLFMWEYLNTGERSKFNENTIPGSNLHQKKAESNWECSHWTDCHPQTVKSGISIEVLGDNAPSVRVKANVEDEYRVTMVAGARFIDLFPDANFCQAVINNMKEKDGIARDVNSVLTLRDWATLASIDELQIAGYGISNLTGIEYFPILDWLHCSENEIAEISPDLIPNLEFLDCRSNRLTKLDLSQWVNLVYLYCDDNQLIELNTSNNPLLYDLGCSNNSLLNLDFSKNSNLSYLCCQNNKLSTLDFTNNISLEYLWCYENYMDLETPNNSIVGLELLQDELGFPQHKDTQEDSKWFLYYPQNAAETEHGWDSGKITTQPNCTKKGVMTYTCTNCGITKTEEIPAKGHDLT